MKHLFFCQHIKAFRIIEQERKANNEWNTKMMLDAYGTNMDLMTLSECYQKYTRRGIGAKRMPRLFQRATDALNEYISGLPKEGA